MLRITAEKPGTVTILHLQGRIVNGVEEKSLRKAVLSQTDASAIVLDLAKVNTIDARGLGLLLELRDWTHARGVEFRLVNVTKLVQQVLELTELNSVFEISAQPQCSSGRRTAVASADNRHPTSLKS